MRNVLQFIRRFLGRIVLLLNVGAIVWLFLCLAAAYTHPSVIRYLSIFSFSTPIAILVNLIFCISWLLFSTRKIRSVLSAIALITCYKLIAMVIGMNYFKPNDMTEGDNRIQVMHWNAHGMGIFEKPYGTGHEKKMVSYLQSQNADILCLPEFPVNKNEILTRTAQTIMHNNGFEDYRFQADNTLGKTIFLGTAVFSKYPIMNFKANKLSNYIYMIQSDVSPNAGDTVRMFFVHLSTFGLSDNDKDYIEDVSSPDKDMDVNLQRSRFFLWKFNYAFLRHAREMDLVLKLIDESPYPVIVCGDFNDLPASYTYTQITEQLNDAFQDRGTGLGRTYNRLSPTMRIDYIFYDRKGFNCVGYESPATELSDHNPVIANFEILNKTKKS